MHVMYRFNDENPDTGQLARISQCRDLNESKVIGTRLGN
jgi:hypothetical protein